MVTHMDRRRNPENTNTHRRCPMCKRVLEMNCFYDLNTRNTRCKDCLSTVKARIYERDKIEIAQRRKALKAECVIMLGGSCVRCGYNEFIAGFEFHHVSDKKNEVARLITEAATGNPQKKALLLAEVSRCILLCGNCHSAYHAGEWR